MARAKITLGFEEPFECPVCGGPVTLVSGGRWKDRIRTHNRRTDDGVLVRCRASRFFPEELRVDEALNRREG